MKELQEELRAYYASRSARDLDKSYNPFKDEMDARAQAQPDASALELKADQYEIIAERFEPVVFRNTPFFSEMGVRIAEYDGIGAGPGAWLMRRNGHLWQEENPEIFQRHQEFSRAGFHLSYGPFVDPDHHCFPYSAVLWHGLKHFYHAFETHADIFSLSVCRALKAVRKIAEKFADAAEKTVPETELQAKHLKMIASAARRIPWEPAETFYEGLCVLWFLHEVCASLDGIGMSVLGRPDYLLKSLYENDLARGIMTKEDAYDLICRFMVHTDCKLDTDRPLTEQFNYGEQGDTLILGGCDENGNGCCSELTGLFLRAHREWKLIYPKIHFRYSRQTPAEFLQDACRDFLNGRNTVSFLNDDVLIPAQVKAGKRLEDARNYVAGGCWEVILEGCEHSQGANCYVNLARILDLTIHDDPELEKKLGMTFRKLTGTEDFEQVFQKVMANVKETIFLLCERIRIGSRPWSRINPSPFFSAALKDCLKNRRDYSAGGARYNPHGLPLSNLAVLTDSLSVIRHLCFERKVFPLSELLQAVRADWKDCEVLRKAALSAPRYGNSESCTELADRILREIYGMISEYNGKHRGIRFQPGLYNYRDIVYWADMTRATPDGRRKGDFLAQGLTPQRYTRSLDIGGILRTVQALPLEDFPADSVLTLTIQRNGMTPDRLAAVVKCFSGGNLQLNCLDRDELLDAMAHPERHRDLIVRLYGYSARFISLSGGMQKEFISRSFL